MSWITTPRQVLDPDVAAYITAVEAIDGQALETNVRTAINTFVVGCKADGIWDAIKACCILAGARTLAGALVPLVGAAPTKFGTEAGWDYNRETGLAGNGTNNYLNSNRNNNADPQNSRHIAFWVSQWSPTANNDPIINTGNVGATGRTYISRTGTTSGLSISISSSANAAVSSVLPLNGMAAMSRASSANFSYVFGATAGTSSTSSAAPNAGFYQPFLAAAGPTFSTARLSFYSIGESLDLGLLDARVATLMSDLAAAIP